MNRLARTLGVALLGCSSASTWAACSLSSLTEWCLDGNLTPIDTTAGSRLGQALVTGDFDGDGDLDLAVGRPATNVFDSPVDATNPEGEVVVLFGDGVFPRVDFIQKVTMPQFPEGELTTRKLFGTSLASADFDGDQIDDLAVGAPGSNLPQSLFCFSPSTGECNDAGAVVRIDGKANHSLSVAAFGQDADALTPFECGINPGDDALYGSAIGVGLSNSNGPSLYVGAPGQGTNLDEDASYAVGILSAWAVDTCDDVYNPPLAGEPNLTARMGSTIAAIRHRTGNSSDALVAFGAPFADFGSFDQTGFVGVGFSGALADGVYSQSVHWPPAGEGNDDHFGAAIVAGDFDGDGDDDFVFAAPDKDTADGTNVGRLYVLRNDNDALTPTSIFEDKNLGANSSETGDQFGFALAVGYINGDKYQDLVIGVPGEECCADDGNEGFVKVMFGSAAGLTGTGFRQFRQSDIGGAVTVDGRFGASLATGDFNHDGLDDIVVGAPDHPVDGNSGAGKVFIARLDGYTGGVNLAVSFTGATNTVGNPLIPPIALQDTAGVTLFGGPVEHVDNPTVTLTYPLGVQITNTTNNGIWACQPSTLSANAPSRTIRCRMTGRLLLSQSSTFTVTWFINHPPAITSVSRQAVASSMTTDATPANNTAALVAAIAGSETLFEDGFE